MRTPRSLAALLTAALLPLVAAQTARPLPAPSPPVSTTVARVEPRPLAFAPEHLARLRVPAGFELSVMATGLGNARVMHVLPNGGLYLARRAQNDIWYLRDANGNGVIDGTERRQVARDLSLVHGMDVREGRLYAVGERTIWVMDILPDHSLSVPRVFADGFPDAGQHPARGLQWGPDGFLYASFGSTNNDVPTQNPEEATMLRISPDGRTREVFARGLRHTIGFQFHPVTGALYGFDHGSDWHGDDIPPEEINRIARGGHYGWPFCYGDRQPDPMVPVENLPENQTKAEFCANTVGSVLNHTAHAAPIGWRFYTANQFPAEFRGDAFVAMRGSWNRSEPSGYELVRVRFENNVPVRVEPFVTGFVFEEDGEWRQFARLAGVAVHTDGSLLFTDDQSGVIYRLRYTGGAR